MPRERNSESEANPRPLIEVEIVNCSNQVLDRYRELYRARYGVDPILPNQGIANTQTKDLIRKVGLERALALIAQYLKLNGDNDWYVRNGHSLRTFENKIEEINAALGLATNRQSLMGKGYNPMIVFNTQCPKCSSWHDITCRGSEADKHAYTTHCQNCINQ